MDFLNELRRRSRLVPAILLAATIVAAAYVLLAEKQYEADVNVLVTPVPAGRTALTGLNLPTDTRDGQTAAETVAPLVESPDVLRRVAERLGLGEDDVREAVSAKPVASANVVRVHARYSDARQAAQLANGVADEFVSQRASRFQSLLAQAIARVDRELRAIPAARRDEPAASRLAERGATLRTYLGERDPTLEIVGSATAPTTHSWPQPLPIFAVALAAGAVLSLLLSLLIERTAFPAGSSDISARRMRAIAQRERALARRAGELAARERELEARAANDDRAAPEQPPVADEREVEQEREQLRARAEELDARAAALEAQERSAREREEQLAAQARALEDRAAASAERETVTERRRRELDERVAAVTEREAAAGRRELDLGAREQQRAARPPAQPVVRAPAAPQPRVGSLTLPQLEHLVAEHADRFPDRVAEWHAYLFQLRTHAFSDGELSPELSALAEEVFAELLAQR